MMVRLGLVLLVSALAGCGEKRPPTPAGPGRLVDAGVEPGGDATGRAGPDEAECAALVAHVLDLGMAKFRDDARASGKPIPTEEQLSTIRDDLTRELTEGCRSLDPETYRCAMAATDVAGYLACETASTDP